MTFQKRQVSLARHSEVSRPPRPAERLCAALPHPIDFLPSGSVSFVKLDRHVNVPILTGFLPNAKMSKSRRRQKTIPAPQIEISRNLDYLPSI